MSPNGAALPRKVVCGRCIVFIRWAFARLGKCRSYGAQNFDVFCFPRVSYRALPSFHPGLCRGVALAGLIVGLGVCGIVSWYCVR